MGEDMQIDKNTKVAFNYEYLKRRSLTITNDLSKTEIKVLSYCLSIQIEKDFKFNKSDCDEIESLFKLTYATTKKALDSLIKKELIYKLKKGCYSIHSSLQYINNLNQFNLKLNYVGSN